MVLSSFCDLFISIFQIYKNAQHKDLMYVLFFDLDGCLTPFDQQLGFEAVSESLKEITGTPKFGTEFRKMFDLIQIIHLGKTDKNAEKLKYALNSYNVQIPKSLIGKKTDFMWSRELWLKYLSDKYELQLNGNIITKIVDGYWDTISKQMLFPHVASFLKQLHNRMFIITSSDMRLLIKNNKIIYNPKISASKKMKRVLKQTGGLFKRKNIIIGDPYDKPSNEFWNIVMKVSQLSKPADGIVIDDSLRICLSAAEFGFRSFVIDRQNNYNKKDCFIVSHITEIDQLPL